MPDGSTTAPREQVPSRDSSANSGTVSHPLMGGARIEPAVRSQTDHVPPPVNIKLSVPILGRRFYFALSSGRERRSKERLALERQMNPIRTKSNVLFIIIGALALYMLTLGTFLVYASVLEP